MFNRVKVKFDQLSVEQTTYRQSDRQTDRQSGHNRSFFLKKKDLKI